MGEDLIDPKNTESPPKDILSYEHDISSRVYEHALRSVIWKYLVLDDFTERKKSNRNRQISQLGILSLRYHRTRVIEVIPNIFPITFLVLQILFEHP